MTPVADVPDEFDLGPLDSAYANAPNEDAPIPDGHYATTVEKVELRRSKSSGAKMLEWTLRITDGPHAGRRIWKYTLLETTEHMARAKTDFKRCGLELGRISELPGRLNDLLDVAVQITLRTKDDFASVYFDRAEREGARKAAGAQGRVF